jgi:hypothetical protein
MALLGQCPEYVSYSECDPIYCSPSEIIVSGPIIEYWYGDWSRKTEFKARIYYGDRLQTVPIVNGYAPEIKRRNGKIVYDFRAKIPYSACVSSKRSTPKRIPLKRLPLKENEGKRDGLLRPSDVGGPHRIIVPTYEEKR